MRVVHIVTVGDDFEELREIEEERIAPWAYEDLDVPVPERGHLSERECSVFPTVVLAVPTSLGLAGP